MQTSLARRIIHLGGRAISQGDKGLGSETRKTGMNVECYNAFGVFGLKDFE